MDKEEKIKIIIQILLDHEGDLSDGYEFYSGDWEDTKLQLKNIAEEIVEKIDEK